MKSLAILAATLVSASALAQMPAPLRDADTAVSPAQWQAAAPKIMAALECRQTLNPADPALRPLFPKNDNAQWELVPPQGFAVFGLPVQSITLYIDPDGEMGASYTASVAATKTISTKAANLAKPRKTKIGSLMAQQGERPSLTNITCTVSGSRDQE